MYKNLGLTLLLGSVFMGVQIYEYCHASFNISDGIFGSTFYMLTGLHGLHGAGYGPRSGLNTQRALDCDSFASSGSTLRGVGRFSTINRAGVNISANRSIVSHT